MRENTDQNKSKHGHFLRSAVNQHTSEAYSKPSKKCKMEFFTAFFILDDIGQRLALFCISPSY